MPATQTPASPAPCVGGAALDILIIDDHALFRSGVAAVLTAALHGVAIRESETLEGGLDDGPAPSVVLLDVRLRGADGLEGMARLRRRWPLAKVVVVSGSEQADLEAEALRRGAAAFMSKAERPERMIAVLRALLRDAAPGRTPPAAATAAPSRLTPRQQEVLELLAQGLSNKAIGKRLGVSEHTVRGHVQAMLGVLNASSRAEAAFSARRLGLLP